MSNQNTRSTTYRQSLFVVNTRSLVGAVLLGLAFVLVQQIAHRIDALINPACVIIGGVTWATFTGLVVLLYGQPAGLITAEVAAFTALASGLSVLAPFFILANGAGSIVYSLVSWKCSMRSWVHHFLAQLVTNLIGNFFVAVGLRVLLHLPYKVILIAAGITTTAGVIGGTILTKKIVENINRAGLVK
jgi:hypothetical protein